MTIAATNEKKPRKLTAKQQAKANDTRVNAVFRETFNYVQIDMSALARINNAGHAALAAGGDDAALAGAMVAAYRSHVPTCVPSIPPKAVAALASCQVTVQGEPADTGIDYATRHGLRIVHCDQRGRAVVSRDGWLVALEPKTQSGLLTAAEYAPVEGREP